ncbi:hypothetical protein [Cohnella panacarvi]|uniref:hypothetical protein n=1 Tax=Cohnella panacarvi TaxID=400776 RepID=UPI00047A740B|nr:hypothetical protein [Cohnella panacarvi]
MSGIVKGLIFNVFPFFENLYYKRVMLKKNEDLGEGKLPLSYMQGYEKLTIDEVEKFHLKTFEYKKQFEDKAKTSLFSITISITLIVTFIDLVFKVEYFKLVAVLMIIVAFTNLLLAGKMAFDVIGNLNIFYELAPSEVHQKKKDKKEILAYSTEYNVNYNTIRNNHVYLSYKSIVVALIAIAFIGILYMSGKALAPAATDKQAEILIQINNSLQQNNLSFDLLNVYLEEINSTLVNNNDVHAQLKDVLNNIKEQISDGTYRQEEILEKLIIFLESNPTETHSNNVPR